MSQDLFAGSRLLSKPVTPEDTNVEVLRRFINRKHGLNLKDYSELHEYSVTDYTFWLDLWQFLGIISSASVPRESAMSRLRSTWTSASRSRSSQQESQ
ncbi:hypothetical protein EDB84DRAFT_1566309 [Lactarius hengduanensis]|nr:hypothetical protein EDB84DRAFT_1566309 [Lactarius hengduanensis]